MVSLNIAIKEWKGTTSSRSIAIYLHVSRSVICIPLVLLVLPVLPVFLLALLSQTTQGQATAEDAEEDVES